MYSNLVATVGASLIFKLPDEISKARDVQKALDFLNSFEDPYTDRSFGAEINSTVNMYKKGILSYLGKLHLIVSDTEDGRFVGEVLREFFKDNKFNLTFDDVAVTTIEGLDHRNVGVFKNRGLRNFIKELARLYRNVFRESMVINATGGYKAVVNLAVIFGQIFRIKVYYMFEFFNEVMEIPPFPVELSNEIFEKYEEIFLRLDCQDSLSVRELLKLGNWRSFGEIPEELKTFIDRLDDDVTFSPMGQLYYEKFELDYSRISRYEFLRSDKSPQEKLKLSKSEHHAFKTFKKYQSVIQEILELPLVSRVVNTGSGERFTGERCSVNVMDDHLKVLYSSNSGNLVFLVFPTCKSQKILHALKEKIDSILC